MSTIGDDFQNLLIFDLLIRNISIQRKSVRKNIEIERDRRVHIMDDYKKLIIEMLDHADDRRLFLIFTYVKAILGLK